jgi:metal-responsive CopG/Arc/MetJ family transcriptional regulator
MRHPPTSTRLPPELLTLVDGVARRNLRTRSKQIEAYIREGLAREGVVVQEAARVG